MPDAIHTEDLRKRFGDVVSLDGVNLSTAEGTVLGLLGPNGAGKTTVVRILSTLLELDSGQASVQGVDVRREPRRVRRMIGLTGQFAAVDDLLTGVENLELIGRLSRLGRAEARRRADELIDRLDLGEVASRRVKTYSGGTRRRLDLAASVINRPRVLFLDEPTTGLDIRSRLAMWDVIDELVTEGMTVLLTTQYLEEADRLSDSITVIDHGRVIAAGTPEELKFRVGGRHVEIRFLGPAYLPKAVEVLRQRVSEGTPVVDDEAMTVVVPLRSDDAAAVPELLAALHEAELPVADLAFRHPTLDDVFLAVTGMEPAKPEGGDRIP